MLFRIRVSVYAKNQFIVIHLGISAENSIPNRKDIAKIRVRVGQYIMMVYPVHAGRYQYPTQAPIQPIRELNIGMTELGGHQGEGLIHKNQADGRATKDNS